MRDVVTTTAVGKVVSYATAGRTSWLDNQLADEPCGFIPNDGPRLVPQAAVIRLYSAAGRGTRGPHAAIPYALTCVAVAVLHGGQR